MDGDLFDPKSISKRSWAAYAASVVGFLATFQKPEAAAC
jgi:hypothetical protein